MTSHRTARVMVTMAWSNLRGAVKSSAYTRPLRLSRRRAVPRAIPTPPKTSPAMRMEWVGVKR
ncbi:MAG: hypothetical protein HYW93_01175 [Thaumarchaeota archaeon]|nr:hypothetical protein [Nitrososphaerota archaeon]